MGNRINFFLTEALRSLSTNVATSLAATLTMIIALFIVGAATFTGIWAHNKAASTERDAGTVRVFLADAATPQQVNNLRSSLERAQNPGGGKATSSVRYIDKAGALREAKKLFKDQPDLLRNLAGNPFPAELRVKLTDPRQAENIAGQMRGQPGVQAGENGVTTGGKIARDVIHGARYIEWGVLVAIAFFLIAAVFLVRNTINLSIFARRREIEVMKLVGASNSFVRLPFMIEGLLCGLFAAVIALLSLTMVKWVIEQIASNSFNLNGGIQGPNQALIALFVLALGITLGSIGSGMSIRRYLRI